MIKKKQTKSTKRAKKKALTKPPKSRTVWCIRDEVHKKYFQGYSGIVGIPERGPDGYLPEMGGTREQAFEFPTFDSAVQACSALPSMILAEIVERKSRRPKGQCHA